MLGHFPVNAPPDEESESPEPPPLIDKSPMEVDTHTLAVGQVSCRLKRLHMAPSDRRDGVLVKRMAPWLCIVQDEWHKKTFKR